MSWLEAAPENNPAQEFHPALRSYIAMEPKHMELLRTEPFPGAACCAPIELPTCKAAPLPALRLPRRAAPGRISTN
jgi:hypothetical protein